MSLYGPPKDTVELHDGITISKTNTGHIIMTDDKGRTKEIHGDAAVEWMFYTLKGEFPQAHKAAEPTPVSIKAMAKYAANKRLKEQTQIVTMEDGTKMQLSPLSIPS